MSHLKKLTDVLGKKLKPAVLRVLKVGHHDTSSRFHVVLVQPPERVLNMTRRLREFVIPSIRMTAVHIMKAHHTVGSLTAQQVGAPLALLTVLKDLKPGQWTGYSASPSDYNIYLNPDIEEPTDFSMESDWEECPSLPKYSPPSVKARCSRFTTTTLSYQTEAGEQVTEEFTGFKARVFQHEIDHMYGRSVLDFSVSDGRLELIAPRDQSKLLDTVREYLARYRSEMKIAEERYLIDTDFKKKIDSKINNLGIEDAQDSLEHYVMSHEFEYEMTRALEDALKDDQVREMEEAVAHPTHDLHTKK